MMQYVAALYDHLVRGKVIDLGDGLPPVLPIVIYNGDARWQHSPEVFDLIQLHPQVLTAFQPRLKFWLLDEGQFSTEYLNGLQRVMAAIFRMENTHDTEEAKQAIRYLGQAVAKSPFKQTIDRAVMQWMQFRLSHKMPGLVMPSIDEILKGSDMLETNMNQWRDKAIAEGVLLGKLEGETTLLELLLVKRFRGITENTRARLKTATAEQLEMWAERILDARTLADVFNEQ